MHENSIHTKCGSKMPTFFKNVIFEKLESQFTIIQNTDIVN